MPTSNSNCTLHNEHGSFEKSASTHISNFNLNMCMAFSELFIVDAFFKSMHNLLYLLMTQLNVKRV